MSGLTDVNLNGLADFLGLAGAIGTAAFGIVDASKAFRGGASNFGFGFIRRTIIALLGLQGDGIPLLGTRDILGTLKGNWINGVALADQKAAAKSLIHLMLTPDSAARMATAVGLPPGTAAADGDGLAGAAQRIKTGTNATPADLNLLGRFDVVVAAALDEAYAKADQRYRNLCKLAASGLAIVMALIAVGVVPYGTAQPANRGDILLAFLLGLVATPVAPIAKDLASTLTAAMSALSKKP